MSDNYNEVYVLDNEDKNIEINPKYVYLTIPAEYVCVYHKLLILMADFGKTIVDDCNATCKGNGKNIFNCWNLFQSAIACKELGKDKEAEFFIDYITKQLNNIYKGSDNKCYGGTFPVSIDNKGELKAIVTCGDNCIFSVDEETGELYQKWIEGQDDGKVYTIEDDELVVKK